MIHKIILNTFKALVVFSIMVLAACETPSNVDSNAMTDTMAAIDAAKSSADAAKNSADGATSKAQAAEDTAKAAKRAADRAQMMSETNRDALRALNDKLDRMFKTMSRK